MMEQSASIESITLSERAESDGIVCTAEGSYPHITGLPSVQVEVNINGHFDEYAYGIRDDIEHCPQQLGDLTEDGAEVLDATDVDFEIARLDDSYLSVVLVRSQYFEGAAHPNNHIDTLTFDIVTGQPLHLEDLLTGDYELQLTRHVAAAVKLKGLGEYPNDLSNPIHKFYLTEEALVLVDLFSAHAVQAFEVEIPLESLAGIWKE